MNGSFDWDNAMLWKQYGMSPDYDERLKLIKKIVPSDVVSFLDIGCGKGEIINELHHTKSGIKIIGVDISGEALSFVRTPKIIAKLPDIPFTEHSFDLVMCLQVIEHISDEQYQKSLAEIERLAAKYIILGVPYKENISAKAAICSCCMKVSNVDDHIRSFDKKIIKSLFKEFRLVEEYLCGVRQRRQSRIGTLINHRVGRYYVVDNFVCPCCGYVNNESRVAQHRNMLGQVAGRVTWALTALSPIMPYWFLGLYVRNGSHG